MDQELIHNPNFTPSSYLTKLWGLFGMVSLIPHTTQQNYVIGQFAKMNTSIWSRYLSNISTIIHFHLTILQPHLLLHIHIHHTSHILCMILWVCTTKGTLQWVKVPAKPKLIHLLESQIFICISISAPTPQNYHHATFLHIFSNTHFISSMENLGHTVSKPHCQRKSLHGTRKRTHTPCECQIKTS